MGWSVIRGDTICKLLVPLDCVMIRRFPIREDIANYPEERHVQVRSIARGPVGMLPARSVRTVRPAAPEHSRVFPEGAEPRTRPREAGNRRHRPDSGVPGVAGKQP